MLETHRQCLFAVRSNHRMRAWLDELAAAGTTAEPLIDFWFWTQSFLLAAGNVSKLLWGTSPETERRREPLRRALGVSEDSPVRSRALRNHFEHIDERIEESARAGDFVGGSVMPSGAFYHPESMPDRRKSQLRNYDPETGLLSFWDDELDVAAIAAELIAIGRAAGPRPISEPTDQSFGNSRGAETP